MRVFKTDAEVISMDVNSDTNKNHVFEVCQRFLQDKYQFNLDENTLREHIRFAIETIDHTVSGSLEEANKAIITKVKNWVLNNYSLADENEFHKRLQDLEKLRELPPKLTTGSASSAPASGAAGTLPFISNALTPVTQPPPSSAITTQNVVYLPEPPKYQQHIIIHGSQRMWEYFPKRSTLIWSGQLKGSAAYCAALLLPKICASQTPVVIIEITGAAGNSIDIACILESGAGAGASDRSTGWDKWIPCGNSVIKALACPWTIKIKDLFQRPLDLGEERSIVQSSQLYNGNTKITLNAHDILMKGSKVLIKKHNESFETVVINYDSSTHAVEIPRNEKSLDQGRVCNMNMQATLVLLI
jgi:hypothetical protein